ncbi:hypothetical protein Smp_175580 [Schistosoma mansoni]|uniref:hypothetical protein n=1 Tax=Schistosoma mansoni TaxID=6183 RepID=UPI0001A627B9|nr:hypothetical protein Smp_175580 [Schistosoma mansoni]|eukprot:XP_018648068.1 hypothetical protein Smp_175580 [Schistosoma mansoni]
MFLFISFLYSACYYAVTNTYYQHKDIWMSAEVPCVKCKCQHGNVHCVGEPHQCPSVCLPGQYSQPAGPCCHTICKGTVSTDITFEFASCLKMGVDTLYSHGEMIILTGICVDQKCQCVNGRWNCFDYCTPLSELSCPSDEMIIWDPFCCPRCRGDQTCSVNIDMKNWLSNPNEKIVNTFKRLDLNLTEWSKSLNNQQENLLIEPISNISSKVNKEIITIQPGQQIVLEQGHCFCLNASIYCPRPGRLIWHEDDCFYMDGQEISYHAVGTRWIPSFDHCTECICEINRTYRCKRQSCQQLFLCPPEQIPMTSEDECCPSYCAPPSQKNREKPNNLKQDIQKNDELNTDSVKQQNRMIQILMNETIPQKPSSSLTPRNTGCSSLIDNENIIQYPDVFPSGSRLLLIRTCRSLLCICAKDNRWVCTDHCPPCEQSVESIENSRHILLPPRDKCCERCNEKINTVHITNQLTQNKLKSQGEIVIQANNQTNPHYLDNEQANISTEMKLKLTVKMYILIFSIILICIFGLPISILIGCYLMKNRYDHHHHRHQYKRKSDYHQYITTKAPKTTRSRYRHYYQRCYSRVKPFLVKSHDYNKDQSELEASIKSPISVSTSSSSPSVSPSSSPVLILKESYKTNNRANYNLTSIPSTTKITKTSENECNSKSIRHRYCQHHHHHYIQHLKANKRENTIINNDDLKLIQPSSTISNIKSNELVNSNDYHSNTVNSENQNSKGYSPIKKLNDYILPTMTTTIAKITNSPVIVRLKSLNETNYTLKKQQNQSTLIKSLSMNDDSNNYNINNNAEDHQTTESKHIKDTILQQYDNNKRNDIKAIKETTTYGSQDKTNLNGYSSSQDKTTITTVLTMNNKHMNSVEQQRNKLKQLENDDKKEVIIMQENMISSQIIDRQLNNQHESDRIKVKHEYNQNNATRTIENRIKQQIENSNHQHHQIICDEKSLNKEIYRTNNNNNNEDILLTHLLTESNENIPLYTYYYQHCDNADTTEQFYNIPRKQNTWSNGNSNSDSHGPVTWPTIQHFTSHPILHR